MASTTSDLALLGRKLGASDYNPDLYVKEIAQRCVGGHELLLQRNNIKVKPVRFWMSLWWHILAILIIGPLTPDFGFLLQLEVLSYCQLFLHSFF